MTSPPCSHTDILLTQGILPALPPFIAGHEGAGKILHLPAGYAGPLQIGDTVLCSFKACPVPRVAIDSQSPRSRTPETPAQLDSGIESTGFFAPHDSVTQADIPQCGACQDARPSSCTTWFPRNFIVAGTEDLFHPSIKSGVQIKLATKSGQPLAEPSTPIYGDFFGQSSMMEVGIVDMDCLVKLPSSLHSNSTDEAPLLLENVCSFGCAVQTGIGTVLNVLLPPPSRSWDHLPQWQQLVSSGILPPIERSRQSHQSIAIFGAGAVGLSAIVGSLLGKVDTIIAIDISDHRLELAKSAGATHVVNSNHFAQNESKSDDFPAPPVNKALIDHIKSLTPASSNGVTMSIEASGSPGVLDSAMQVLATGGRCASVGAGPPGVALRTPQDQILANGWTVGGVTEGASDPFVFLPYLVGLFMQGGKEWNIIREMVKTYRVEDFQKALKDSKEGKTVKPVILW